MIIWVKFVWCQVVVTIQDGNGPRSLGDIGDGDETGAVLALGSESGPDFTGAPGSPALYAGIGFAALDAAA
jgi:hypothetical protein